MVDGKQRWKSTQTHTHSLTHSLTHTHSFTHSFIHSSLLQVGWFPGKYVQPVPTPSDHIPSDTPTSDTYKANYTFNSEEEGDLSFAEGDIIKVIKKDGEWWLGELDGRKGLFPSTYVSAISAPDSPSLQMLSTKEAGSARLVGRVTVGFIALEENQLGLVPGQLVLVRRQEPNGWWEGQLQSRGMQRRYGWFPANRIELLTSGTGAVSPGVSISVSNAHV